jgi:hypothetical protein
MPYFWIAVAVFSAIVIEIVAARRQTTRLVLVNLATVVLVLGLAEAYLALFSHDDEEWCQVAYPPGYMLPDDVLGTVPAPGFVASSVRKRCGGQVLYDVKYTIDQHGLRDGCHHEPLEGARTILFFGDSFTFGEGLDDREALPCLVEERLGSSYRAYNFAWHGYGPNQMLAALEERREEKPLAGPPRLVIFQSLGQHIRRVSGLVSHGKAGPRYEIAAEGGVRRAGRLLDQAPWFDRLPREIAYQLKKSALLRNLVFRRYRQPDAGDARLCAAIIARARDIVEGRYPGCQFQIIHWDSHYLEDADPGQRELSRILVDELRQKGIRVHLISEILPDPHDQRRHSLHALDSHPNAAANVMVADYIVRRLVQD